MRDSRSFTGVNGTQNLFVVSNDGEFILFKKSSKELYFFNVNMIENSVTFKLVIDDVLHADDTIFDLFYDENQLVILLQSPINSKICIALCFVDLESRSIIVTEIKPIALSVRNKGGFSKVIQDELGYVFISFPSTFESDDPKQREIQLFHISDYLNSNFDRIKTISIEQRKPRNKAELWCDPFFSRGALYFFNQFDHQLLVISATEEFQCRIIQTKALKHGSIPSKKFVHRTCIIYEDFAFIFFSQLLENGKKIIGESDNQAWKLYLNSMEWEPIDLFLSAHAPVSKVTMRCASKNNEKIFIHGACNISGCLEQYHLYEFNLGFSPRIFGGIQYADVYTEKSVDKSDIKKSPSLLQYVNVAAKDLFRKNKTQSTTKNHKIQKEIRKRSNSQSNAPGKVNLTNRLSTHSMNSCLTQSSSSSTNSSGVSWSRLMALEPSPKLIEQLSLAREMGFSENDIMAALEMKNYLCKSKLFSPFHDTSEMLDKLDLVQKCKQAAEARDRPLRFIDSNRRSTEDSDSSSSSTNSSRNRNSTRTNMTSSPDKLSSLKFPPNWTSTAITPRTTSVNRSASFTNSHGYSPLMRRPRSSYFLNSSTLNSSATNSSSLQRLIETFDNDRKALYEEFGKELAEMKMKLEHYARDKRIAEEKAATIEEENNKLKSQLRDRDQLEQHLRESEHLNEELRGMINNKNAEIDVLRRDVETFNELAEKANELSHTLRQKEEQYERKCNDFDALEREFKMLGSPDTVLRQMEEEIIQLKHENREFRDKQAALVCTTCMDQPRNVLYMPCLHFICCLECAVNSDTCSICRTRIMGKVEVYQ